MDNISQLLSAC